MKILIACDSFKGSLSSLEVASHIKKAGLKVFSDAQFDTIEMADGGEGTVQAMLNNIGGQEITVKVFNPHYQEVEALFGILNNNVAIIEMASASGLPLVKKDNDIYKASTYGTGQLIKSALDYGCKEIYIGIGGSATNDAGIGMAKALGVKFLDKDGHIIKDEAYSLPLIHSIDMSSIDARIHDTAITVMCDVDNPLCGYNGASYVYGPQKGASHTQIEYLDTGLRHLVEICQKSGLKDDSEVPGSGAAGGLGFGLMTFLNAHIEPGIDIILKASSFIEKLENTDLVITGEGRIDNQSIHGKVPIGVAKLAKQKNIPVIAIVGSIGKDIDQVYNYIDTIESCIDAPCTLEEALTNARENIENATKRVLNALKIGKNL